jgi:hypothetical protein
MANGWGGADPVLAVDAASYELGTEYRCNDDVTLTHVRVWADATSLPMIGRHGHVWSTAGVLLGAAILPETLAPGWSSHALSAPIERSAGQRFVVSYETNGNYGALAGALASDVDSADGALTALADAGATNGNGVFHVDPGVFPVSNSGTPFYGVDVEYTTTPSSGGDAPTITDVEVTADALEVSVTITATDPSGLVGATYAVEWGDGASSSGAGSSYSHTYASPGLKAILARVVDSTDVDDHAAAAIVLRAESAESVSPIHPLQIALYDRLTGDAELAALVSGVFDRVPETKPLDYVHIGEWLSTPDNSHGSFGRQAVATLHVWTRAEGNAKGQAIAARIVALLDHQPLEVDGHRVVSIRCEFDQALRDPDPQVRHHVLRFRITTSQE